MIKLQVGLVSSKIQLSIKYWYGFHPTVRAVFRLEVIIILKVQGKSFF